ncbi:cold-shock protein [Taibaiella koreensis]|uniref:cold-shock protein n=1 Tax=Taibaiella koreensis TaxID=1268548 RepID=UPI000E59D726|nr:cold shock domain-containing protein [Taibaiella koreensis]
MGRSHETSGKKEIAKKKKEKQKAKAEKKELRQSNTSKGKDLEDMMAYVDENGNLSTQPPDPRRKKEIKPEDISLSASGNNDREPTERQGTVTFFDLVKGFGFIKDADTSDSFFVHNSDLSSPVKENDKVVFEVARGQKGMKAILVRKLG